MCKDCGGSGVSSPLFPFSLSPHCHDGGCVSSPYIPGVLAGVTLTTRILLSGRLEVYSCVWIHGYCTLFGVCSAVGDPPLLHDPGVSCDSCANISEREACVRIVVVVGSVPLSSPSPSPRTVMMVVACQARVDTEE